jgi:hypothetical protein
MAVSLNIKVDEILPAEELIKMVESLEETNPGTIGYFTRLSQDVKNLLNK